MKPRMWFLPSCGAKILVTGFEPFADITQYIVIVPPFAEEMNKSRKACSDFARQLAMTESSSTAVYLIDLFGCGDSEGEFCDASWGTWRQNIIDLVTLLSEENPQADCVLLGLRLGASLALSCAIEELANKEPTLVFWQPVLNGKQYVNQFLRMKIAASMITSNKVTMTQLRAELAQEHIIEVSGYALSSLLVDSIEAIKFQEMEKLPPWMKLFWFETGANSDNKLLPVSEKVVGRWQKSNPIISEYCQGDAFWQSVETTTAPTLANQVISHLSGAG